MVFVSLIYYRFKLNYRSVGDLLSKWGIIVAPELIRLQCNKFRYTKRLKRSHKGLLTLFTLINVLIRICICFMAVREGFYMYSFKIIRGRLLTYNWGIKWTARGIRLSITNKQIRGPAARIDIIRNVMFFLFSFQGLKSGWSDY